MNLKTKTLKNIKFIEEEESALVAKYLFAYKEFECLSTEEADYGTTYHQHDTNIHHMVGS